MCLSIIFLFDNVKIIFLSFESICFCYIIHQSKHVAPSLASCVVVCWQLFDVSSIFRRWLYCLFTVQITPLISTYFSYQSVCDHFLNWQANLFSSIQNWTFETITWPATFEFTIVIKTYQKQASGISEIDKHVANVCKYPWQQERSQAVHTQLIFVLPSNCYIDTIHVGRWKVFVWTEPISIDLWMGNCK